MEKSTELSLLKYPGASLNQFTSVATGLYYEVLIFNLYFKTKALFKKMNRTISFGKRMKRLIILRLPCFIIQDLGRETG